MKNYIEPSYSKLPEYSVPQIETLEPYRDAIKEIYRQREVWDSSSMYKSSLDHYQNLIEFWETFPE